ncbi:MAG: ABC transporter [Chromatiaceae bacterium]|nr:MAG: ABC transporter [Chromatiaceae bacterium]
MNRTADQSRSPAGSASAHPVRTAPAPAPTSATATPTSPALDATRPAPSPCSNGLTRWRLQRLDRAAADLVYALLLFALLVLGGWLGSRHEQVWDWTSTRRNSLSAASEAVLARLQPGLDIRVFSAPGTPVGRAVEQLLQRYRRSRPDLRIRYVDPHLFPEQARAAEVRLHGQLLLEYQGRRETLQVLDEASLTNAIARLMLTDPPWIAVLEGHGERALHSAAGSDIGRLGQLLEQRGLRVRPLDLASQPAIPDNAGLLLLSLPTIDLFPGEAAAIRAYLKRGGNLLWLLDPPASAGDSAAGSPLRGLEPIADYLGIALLPGQIVDAAGAAFSQEAPTLAVLADWPDHPLGRSMTQPALFPGAVAFAVTMAPGWLLETTLGTGALSWNETGTIRGEIARDPTAGEQAGPLPLALVLSRPHPATAPANPDPDRDPGAGPEPSADPAPATTDPGATPPRQRVILVGDGDFLSNAHLDQGANQTLALRMVRWLLGREDLVEIPATPAAAPALQLPPARALAIRLGTLLILPLLLVGTGLLIHWQRARA